MLASVNTLALTADPMLENIRPKSAEVQHVTEALELHQAAIDFQRELEHRQAFEDYCQWYYRLAAQNQAEYSAMKNDANSFWWWRKNKQAAPQIADSGATHESVSP